MLFVHFYIGFTVKNCNWMLFYFVSKLNIPTLIPMHSEWCFFTQVIQLVIILNSYLTQALSAYMHDRWKLSIFLMCSIRKIGYYSCGWIDRNKCSHARTHALWIFFHCFSQLVRSSSCDRPIYCHCVSSYIIIKF